MKIVIGAATEAELSPCVQLLGGNLEQDANLNGHNLTFMITGVGSLATAVSWLTHSVAKQADLWVMAGIAGTFDEDIPLGSVVEVVSEKIGDLGVEHRDGSFEDVYTLGLSNANEFPLIKGALLNPETFTDFHKVTGITYQTTGGQVDTIRHRKEYGCAQVESMEGAGFFYAALMAGKPFCQLRAISNFVEPRDRSKWDITLALDELAKAVKKCLVDIPV